MGRTIKVTYRLELNCGPKVYNSPMCWRTKQYGRPTPENLEKWVMGFAESMKPGGVNAHLCETAIYWPVSAKVVHQDSGNIVARWKAPMFMVW